MNVEGSISEVWESIADNIIRSVAKDVLGENRGKIPQDKQTWWWKKEEQAIISKKIPGVKFVKNLGEDWVEYKNVC